MMRARTCELLGNKLDGEGDRLFLRGLCSMLDTMLGVPLEAALEALPLANEIQAALLGEPGTERSLLDAVVACERGDWITRNGSPWRLVCRPPHFPTRTATHSAGRPGSPTTPSARSSDPPFRAVARDLVPIQREGVDTAGTGANSYVPASAMSERNRWPFLITNDRTDVHWRTI